MNDTMDPNEQPDGDVTEVGNDVGDADASDNDDAEGTDHLARLGDDEVNERVQTIEEREHGKRYDTDEGDDAASTD